MPDPDDDAPIVRFDEAKIITEYDEEYIGGDFDDLIADTTPK